MTWVRGSKQRTERTTVISNSEFSEALANADKLPTEYFQLRAKAVLSMLRLTGKRRGEIAQVPLANFVQKGNFLNVTFILEKKRKGSVLQKQSTKSLPLNDDLTRRILAYLDYLNQLETRNHSHKPSS
jgi:site-specific recombinase XerD